MSTSGDLIIWVSKQIGRDGFPAPYHHKVFFFPRRRTFDMSAALPELVLSHPSPGDFKGPIAARKTKVILEGVDITSGVTSFRVGGDVKGAIEVELTLLVSNVRWENE